MSSAQEVVARMVASLAERGIQAQAVYGGEWYAKVRVAESNFVAAVYVNKKGISTKPPTVERQGSDPNLADTVAEAWRVAVGVDVEVKAPARQAAQAEDRLNRYELLISKRVRYGDDAGIDWAPLQRAVTESAESLGIPVSESDGGPKHLSGLMAAIRQAEDSSRRG